MVLLDYMFYFLMWQIWVTRYNRSEQWASGLLVYQSKGEDTLAVWSARYICNSFVSSIHLFNKNNLLIRHVTNVTNLNSYNLKVFIFYVSIYVNIQYRYHFIVVCSNTLNFDFDFIDEQESTNREQGYSIVVHNGISSRTMSGGFSSHADGVFKLRLKACQFF